MTIEQNKKQTVLYAIIALIFAVISACGWIFDLRKLPHDPSLLLDNGGIFWACRGLCLLYCFFCAAGAVYLFKQISSKEPLLVLCDEYFYDNSSAIALGKIAWEDMERAYFLGGFLNIKLKQRETYCKKMNPLQMYMIWMNRVLGYGDVCVSTVRFREEEKAFLEEFCKRKEIQL